MKELSIEEKAKAYDEAINRMKHYVVDEYGCSRIKVADVFPDLEESENIRIIKAIKYGLDHVFTNNTTVFEVTKEQCLAWLEKQGDPTDIPADALLDGNKDGFIAETIRYKREKQGEQKSAAWSEENELSCFESALFTAFSDAWQSYLLGGKVNVKQWAKEHSKELLEAAKEELKEQKPAWSEEDEVHQLHTISLIEDVKDWANKDGMHSLCIERCIESLDWLKSVKDRCAWKPSDEQITWLYRAADEASKDSRMKQILNGLLSDLKKLKG